MPIGLFFTNSTLSSHYFGLIFLMLFTIEHKLTGNTRPYMIIPKLQRI